MNDKMLYAYSAMKHNEYLWNKACKTITDLINYKNARLWLQNPDGSTCMIKLGTKILDSDGNIFEITENTKMKTAEIVKINYKEKLYEQRKAICDL